MPRPVKLDDQALSSALARLTNWSVVSGKLHRDFKFADFAAAFGFMAMAVSTIEKMDHHPEWSNVYSRVSVDLVTHDAGGITQLDVDLAAKLDQIAAKLA